MFDKILVPVNNSILSSKVLINAVRFARDQKAELIVLNVEEPHAGAFSTAIVYHQDTTDVDANPVIKEVKQKLADVKDIQISYRVAAGNAADCIITVSETERCNLIIIGSRGITGLTKILAGSVSNGVADKADIPVLIIK